MRPTPDEIVAGVIRILREEVAPALVDEHARAQLDQVVAVLGQADWGDAAFAMARSDRATRALLDDIRRWADEEPASRGTIGRLAVPADPSDGAEASFGAARSSYEAGRRALEAVVRALGDLGQEGDRDPSRDALLDRVGAELA